MDECIDSLGEVTIFSTLNCNASYWQVAIAPEDRKKTAFVCHEGAYQNTRMPFGLTNPPATFQRALDIILSCVKWQSCLIYLEDVIVYSKTEDEYVGHVDRVLRLLRDAKVTLRLPKCRFFRRTVEYLGHEIKPGRLGVTRARCASWCRGGRGKCEEDEVKVVLRRDGQGARLGKVRRYDKKTSCTVALPAWAASRSTS